MYWAAAIVGAEDRWLLVEDSIKDNALDTIEYCEASFKKDWNDLRKNFNVTLVRLRQDKDGRPCDLMFAWGSGYNEAGVEGIIPYDEDFEKNGVETDTGRANLLR